MTITYYDKQSVKVAMMGLLKQKGWKIYGYRPDESDMMTDYWSPARWKGIAEKDGYILLVDVYGTHDSGRKITEKSYVADPSKIRKLKALRDDPASTENEKASCDAQIARLKEKEEKGTKIIEQYPAFTQGNPKRASWHVEKDGELIAKGTGVFSCYESNDKALQTEKLNKLITRIEQKISAQSKLVKKTVVEEIKEVKPVKVERSSLSVGDIVNFNNSIAFYKVIKVRENGSYEMIRLGKKWQELKHNDTNYKCYNAPSIHRCLTNGYAVVYKLKEVTTKKEKTVYVPVERKDKQEPKNAITASPKNRWDFSSGEKNSASVSLEEGTGPQANGLELTFSDKPAEEVREHLKANGFRWNKRKKVWYAVANDERLTFARQLASQEEAAESKDIEEADQEEMRTSDTVKIAIKEITFQWSEAPSHIVKDNTTVASLKEANQIIFDIACNRANEEGYTKTAFTIEWNDGHIHEGRIDVNRSHCNSSNPLGEHVKYFIGSLAGKNKPAQYTDEQYRNFLKSVYKIDSDKMREFEKFLQVYQLEEAAPVRTVDEIEQEIKKLRSEHSTAYDSFVRENHHNSKGKISLANSIAAKIQELELVKLCLKSDAAGKLFYSAFLTKGQNARLNLLANKYADNVASEFVGAYVKDNDYSSIVAHVISDDKDYFYRINSLGKNAGLIDMGDSNDQTKRNDQIKNFQSNYSLIENEITIDKDNASKNTVDFASFPDINIDDVSTYKVSADLSGQENDGHWIFRKKPIDHEKELQDHLQNKTDQVKEVLAQTDSRMIEYKLKKELQRYKKKYADLYIRRLTNRANNPSWAVTGRAGRNTRKDEKAAQQFDKIMGEIIALDDDFQKLLKRYTTMIKKEKAKSLLHVWEEKGAVPYEFKTKQTSFVFMGQQEKGRVYIHEASGIWFTNTWGAYRVFDKVGKELYTFKTTDKLDYVKQVVTGLIQYNDSQAG
ncbi:hypothetical protein [Shouchella clausii]|uniref:hypothetical protein n=1 Tax=Shouchella clausii TaxID=79880 RepID=UPI001C734C53|nr:hypothetical protein [Shouchella clausii]MBX0320142.1 hypothetical protein [Shouchella clausii]